LLLIAIILLPLIVMTTSDMSSDQLRVPAGLSAGWLSLVGLTISLFLIYVGWRVIRAILLYPFGSWQVFGATTSARLIGLGITAIITPRAVERLLMIPATFLLRLIERLTRQAASIPLSFGPSSRGDSTVSIQEPLIRLSIMILDVLAEVGRVVGQAFEGLLTPDVIIALGIWVIAGSLLSAAGANGEAMPSGVRGNRLSQYIKAMSAAQRHGIVLTTVFLIGAYLSIAAIVAIPWLHEEKVSPGLSREGLEKILNGILPTATPLDAPLKDSSASQEDPLASLTDFLLKRPKPSEGFDATLYSLNVTIAEGRDARAKAVSRLQQMPFEISQRVAQMRQAALGAFDLETATLMSNQERGYFMREIQRSISSDYLRLEGARKNCTNALAELDKQFREFSETTIAILRVDASANLTDSARASDQQMKMMLMSQPIANASRSSRVVRDACETPELQQTVYTAPVAGSGWGPFGVVARWLLQTKSLPLTLITGMLGFGLLGSAIATFVRRGPEREQVSLTAEVTSVLVRGLSAAVVVFLAVKGGLAIFSSGDNEPNAYVVFLTCLVGAVFSEDVWIWARKKFLENLKSEDSRTPRKATMAEAIEGSGASVQAKDDAL
jgi:hypothetical protein